MRSSPQTIAVFFGRSAIDCASRSGIEMSCQ
jgi:hypothetical protein